MISCLFWCLVLFSFCDCSYVFHEGSKITFRPNYPADFFGYAVAVSDAGLIVGAPKATIRGSPLTTGAVFSCPLQHLETRFVTCTPLNVNSTGFHNGMWFGASLAVGPTGKMVICAPRWGPSTRAVSDTKNVNGACYLRTKRFERLLTPFKDGGKQFMDISNSRADYSDYHFNAETKSVKYYESAQAGMSTKVTADTIIIGAPGLLLWSGGIVQYTFSEKSVNYYKNKTYNPYYTPDIHPDEYFGGWTKTICNHKRCSLKSEFMESLTSFYGMTVDGVAIFDVDRSVIVGYSVESGVFEDGGSTLYVAGGPKGKRGFGMVLVFEPATREEAPLTILARLEGPQLGSYFGASLSCLDINGDGRTDLLVGAPNYVLHFPKDDVYDQGAVFVYLNKEQATGFILDYAGRVTGSEANGAKFGYSIANLGDIDSDGYNDIAVGAPWENNGAGAIYVYRGHKYGLKHDYVQRIVASEARSFGMALARGQAVDKCNDLVVGAHETGAAYIYRCIPTVKVQATITIPGALNLPQNATNFTVQCCVNVQPLRVYPTVVVMDFTAKLTIDPAGKRATIAGNSTYAYKMSAVPSSDSCEDKIIEIKPGADLSRPISITLDLEPTDRMQGDPTKFLTNAGRISEDSNLNTAINIQLVKDCGKDLICTPWLEMTLEPMNEPYVPGAGGRLGAILKVLNKGEPAFGIRVNLTLPSLPKRVPPTCNLQGLDLTCDLPSPFNENETAEWEIEFEYTQDFREIGLAILDANIDDSMPNRVVSDTATQYLIISIMPVANISATGKALPNATRTVSREKFDAGVQIPLAHYFQITNAGPSDWPDLTARILVSGGKGSPMVKEIAGCAENWDSGNLILSCSWPVKAKQSLPVVLSMAYDLAVNGKSLEADTTCNITSTLFLGQQNISLTLTTVMVLESAPMLWIPIIAAIIVGLLLVALLSYTMYKWGFFSRAQSIQASKEMDRSTLLEEPCCSSSYLPLDSAAADNSKEDLMKRSCSTNSHAPESTFSNCFEPSELDNSLPPLSFQGPIESAQNGEVA